MLGGWRDPCQVNSSLQWQNTPAALMPRHQAGHGASTRIIQDYYTYIIIIYGSNVSSAYSLPDDHNNHGIIRIAKYWLKDKIIPT